MKELKRSLKLSLPVCFGYLFLGIAFSLLALEQGFSVKYAVFSSIFVFAGSMQFALIPLLLAGTPLWMIALMTLMINARMLFYGISFVDLFKRMGWKGIYMIWVLSDETFSLFTGMKDSQIQYSDKEYLYVAVLNHLYWILGTFVGGIAGNMIPVATMGIDFSMTALFVVIVVNQWENRTSNYPFIIGLVTAIVALLLVGPKYFLLLSLTATIVSLVVIFEVTYFKERGGVN
ncbi:4-azaleucine resistance probable transporter AzlC [Granulicatella balaenopterae]|uniref:4-azaleucine resistance probable transporter AzlC n=1 Tax=Granulicatella balaenopterae TaxID=137733 RepID=A0A1H9MMV4_9LACT|nr:AzlC family ABC transporter permease [Granulicatella balaenopterae]SER25040.1 4-azaleucine resistance probable transporter AzlC [Granulicatella balaenopterae]